MSIEVILKTKNQTLTYDLMDYLGNFGDFVDAIYQDTETTTPINVNTDIEIVDTEYFNSFFDIAAFLTINFDYDYYAIPFLVWVERYNGNFNDYSKFKTVFKGVFKSVEDFAKEYIKHNIKSIPKYVLDAVDWNSVWEHLSNEFVAIKVEDDRVESVSIYHYAIFQKPIPNSKS